MLFDCHIIIMAEKIDILFEKLVDGTCSESEFNIIMDFLKEEGNEGYARNMLQILYKDIDQSFYTSKLDKIQSVTIPKAKTRNVIYMKYAATAAAVVVFVVLALFIIYPKRNQTSIVASASEFLTNKNLVEQATKKSERKHIVLTDGTQVWLNSESSLTIPEKFDKNKREVFLNGEAFFDVKHAEEIPFIIHTANHVSTRVLGTAFDIKAYDGQDMSVSVQRGKVQVQKDKKILATLIVGQQIKISSKDVAASPLLVEVKEEKIAGWRAGALDYEGWQFSDIIEDLKRNYNVQIELQNIKVGNEIISVSFNQKDKIDNILSVLCTLTNTNYTFQNNSYIIH